MYQLIKKLLTQFAVKVKLTLDTVANKTIAAASNLSKLSAVSLRVAGAISIQAIAINMPKLTTASLGLSVPSKSLNGSILSSLLSKIITIALAILVVSCAASSSSSSPDGNTGNQVTAFSHSSYTFASDFSDSDSVPGIDDVGYTPSVVGTVFRNDNQIKLLAATLIGTTDPKGIVDLTEGTDYTVAFSLVADATRPDVGQYFSVDSGTGEITVTNPFGVDSDLTFGDIRGFLRDNSINVKVTITVTNPADAAQATTDNTVRVTILDSSAALQLDTTGADAAFIYDIASISFESTTETNQSPAQNRAFTSKLTGSSIASGTVLGTNGEFLFSDLLPAATFAATTATPTGGVLATPGNAFAAADIYNATHITQELTVNVNVSLNSNGSLYVAGAISFPANTTFTLVDANVATTGSFLNLVSAFVATSSTTNDLLDLTAGTNGEFNLAVNSWEATYSFTREFTPAATTRVIPGRPTFTVTGDVAENNLLAARATFGTPNNAAVKSSNPITSFSIQRAAAGATAPQVTLFYGLRSLDNTALCGDGAIYLDNNDLTVKAGAIFDFEGLTQKTYQCRLAVSSTGSATSYSPFALVLNNGTAAGSAAPVGTSVADLTGVAQVAQSGTDKQVACSVTNPCYYADLNITITDGNDAPVVTLVGNAAAFAGSVEGKGVRAEFNNATKYGFRTFGDNLVLNTTTGPDSVQINITDPDTTTTTQTGTDTSNVRVAVSPVHGAAAFSINQSIDREVYELVVNSALLDYEAFAKTDLTEAGEAIYKITITAADNTTSTLTDSETFNFEVKDVKFTPVFVNLQDSTPLEPAAAFVKEDDIIAGPDGSPLYLLSDIRALNRIGIGSIAAVDPETSDGAGIVYRFVPSPNPLAPTVVHRNIALVPSTNKLSSRLRVSGVGLTVGDTGAVLFQASKDTSFTNGTSNSGPVALEVNNTAYANAAVLIPAVADPAAVDINFNRGIPLLVILPEMSATDAVIPLPFAVTLAANTPPILVTDISTPVTTPSGPIPLIIPTDPAASPAATPAFGFVDSSLFAAIANTPLAAEIASLGFNLAADLSTFSINSATGQISVNTSKGLTFPSVFTLPIYVTGATNGAFNLDTADITIVTVVITDVNVAPQAISLTRTPLNNTVTGQISVSIAENLPAGTPIANTTFILTDDNLPLGGVPAFSFTGAAADLFDVTTQTNTITVPSPSGDITVPGSITVTLVTKQSFNYENATLRTDLMSDLTLVITDAGSYTLFGAEASGNPLDASFLRVPEQTINPADALTAEVKVSITLTDDVNEAPALEVVEGTHSIAENSANNDAVTSSATGNVIARITNTDDFPNTDTSAFNSSRVALTVTGDFVGILEARYIDTDAGAISLTVVDADALENLGDGLTFTATIVATAAGFAPVSDSVQVRIRNIPANSRVDQAVIDALIADAGITINEQDVAGQSGAYSIPAASFNVPVNSLVKDADDTIGTGASARPVVRPALALGSVTLTGNVALNPELAQTDILTLKLENGNYRLSINDADFVENALFNSVSFTLNVSTISNAAGVLAADQDSITFTQAANKNVAYANVARAATTPPVYALSYTQTAYADAITNFTGIDATTITTINASTSFNFGGAVITGVTSTTEYINISSENVYPTLTLVNTAGGALNGNFIARDYANPATFNSLNSINTAVENGVNITINFESDTLSLLDANGQHQFDILKPNDATGNLEDASAEFNAYFNLAVDNTAGERSIQIAQKLFTQADNDTRKYNALDTIQLYQGARARFTLHYFIRARSATDGTTNASNYALAQFSVAVSAAGRGLRGVDVTTPFSDRTVAEGFSGLISGLILELTDGDLPNIADGTDISSSYSITFSPDFLTTTTISKETAATNVPIIRASGVMSRELMDADVNVHTVSWTLRDTSDTISLQVLETGNFTLTVNRLEDPAANGRIAFTDTEADDLTINLNTELSKTFPISLTFDDVDLFENPPVELTAASYDSVTFGAGNSLTCLTGQTADGILLGNLDNLDYITNPGSVTVTGVLANGNDPITFGDVLTGCPDIAIGSTINTAIFADVKVTSGGITDLGDITTSIQNPYTIQGFRTQVPTITSSNPSGADAHVLNVPADASATITLTITDTDTGDGTPLTPTNPNAIRGAGTAGIEWASALAGVTHTCSSSQIVSNGFTVGAYVSTSNDAEANVDITVTSQAGATGTCAITVPGAGEDGENFSTQTINVNIESFPPTLRITPPTAEQLFGYAAFPLLGTVATSDPVIADIIVSFAFDSEVCTISPASVTIPGASAATTGPLGSITVTPIKPGDCAISVTAEEQGVVSAAITPASVFPEVTPTFIATSSIARQRTNAAGGSASFTLTLNASNRDIGDDAGADDVAFAVTSASGLCTAVLTSNTGAYDSETLGATATATVTISPATGAGGACQQIVVTATEDGEVSTVTIPQDTFVFDSAPTLGGLAETSGLISNGVAMISDFNNRIVYTVTLTSGDGNVAGALISAVSMTTTVCGIRPSSISPTTTTDSVSTTTITINPIAPGACSIVLSGIEDDVPAVATLSIPTFTIVAPPPNFSDATANVNEGFRRRGASIRVTAVAASDFISVDFSNSGCVVSPAFAIGATSYPFTVTQRSGSVGSTNCVDVGVHTNSPSATGGSIIIKSMRGGVESGRRVYADNTIPFFEAAVELELVADDYNIISGSVEDLSAAADSHIYNFLDARRWYFDNDGDNALNSYALYRGIGGQSALATTIGGGLDYFFNADNGLVSDSTDSTEYPDNEGVARVFFVNPSAVPNSVLTTNYETAAGRESSLENNGYDTSFFSSLTNYAVDGYLKLTTTDASNANAVATSPGNGGAFIRGLATSENSTKPLVGIATAAGSATISGFALKARICRIAATGSVTGMQQAALNGKALSCDAEGSVLLTDAQAAKIISLGSDWDFEAGEPIGIGATISGACSGIGTQVWSNNATIYESFCGGVDVTGGAIAMNVGLGRVVDSANPIRWSFQQYLGTRTAAEAPASMFESGIYLAEVYPVPFDNTDLSELLGKPVRILFEVFTQ